MFLSPTVGKNIYAPLPFNHHHSYRVSSNLRIPKAAVVGHTVRAWVYPELAAIPSVHLAVHLAVFAPLTTNFQDSYTSMAMISLI
jgi:hypothetical protein